MLRLDFNYGDLGLPELRAKASRASISGVQEKVQLRRVRGGFAVVETGGDFILKPAPRNTAAEHSRDIPLNEWTTMQIAKRIFSINTAEHDLVAFADGELAYVTRRFDYRNGVKIRQEDFCQLSNRTEAKDGPNYKYDASYEELAELMRKYCASALVDNPKIFKIILFNYVFANGDAHLKNFSLLESPQGDYILSPAYDLLNTAVHFRNEPSATGLDFFANGHFTARYEELGFYSSVDFIELGKCFSVGEVDVRAMIDDFIAKRDAVEELIGSSPLSAEVKRIYLTRFNDRLKAISL